MLTTEGERLQSRILGIGYSDVASGQSVLIAEIKDAIGELVARNQILYRDAFTDIAADVRFTHNKWGFEQDILLRENPPPPEEFGLAPEGTRLEVWTEFFDPPEPEKNTRIIARHRTATEERLSSPASTFCRFRVLMSARSASFSWVKPFSYRARRTFAPKIFSLIRSLRLKGTTYYAVPERKN